MSVAAAIGHPLGADRRLAVDGSLAQPDARVLVGPRAGRTIRFPSGRRAASCRRRADCRARPKRSRAGVAIRSGGTRKPQTDTPAARAITSSSLRVRLTKAAIVPNRTAKGRICSDTDGTRRKDISATKPACAPGTSPARRSNSTKSIRKDRPLIATKTARIVSRKRQDRYRPSVRPIIVSQSLIRDHAPSSPVSPASRRRPCFGLNRSRRAGNTYGPPSRRNPRGVSPPTRRMDGNRAAAPAAICGRVAAPPGLH